MSTKVEKRIASTDEAEAMGIQNAVKFGRPIYFLQHVNGSVIDVGTDRARFLKEKEEYVSNTFDGRYNIRLYERVNGQLRAI
jgi:hypothetical protein